MQIAIDRFLIASQKTESGTPLGVLSIASIGLSVVSPEDVHVLDPTPEPTLTLVTCFPFFALGPAPKRFIVHAVRVGEGD